MHCFKNKADVALDLPYDMMREEKIEVRTFNQNPLYLCVHQEHPFARLEEFTSDMLPEVDLIACDPKIVPEVYRFHYDCEKIYGVKPRTFLKTKTVEEIILLIRLNRGVSLLPKYMFGQHICYDEIVGIPFTYNGKMQYMRSAMGYEKTNSNPAVKRFTEYLLHYLE